MSAKVHIYDGQTAEKSRVTDGGFINSLDAGIPPGGRPQLVFPFRQNLTTNGRSTGSSAMAVVGTLAAPIEFFVLPPDNEDLYIVNLSVLISDANQDLSEFGGLGSPLTNGVLIQYSPEGRPPITIHPGVTTNFEFIRLSLGQPAFGDAATAFEAQNVVGTSDAYLPVINLRATFGLTWGVKLTASRNERISMFVRDTLTGLDAFNVVAFGFTRPIEM